MPYFADTHAHIYVEEFDVDREAIAQRAFQANVQIILLPNIDSSTTDALKQTANMDAGYHPMMGIHPCSIKPLTYKEELNHVLAELDSGYQSEHGKGYCAVGEIGIDIYWDKSTLGIQIEAFEQQMLWAHERNLPVAVHCRDAYDEVISSISNMGADRPKGVLHCFTGTLDQANALIELGFLLGIGGVVTFKNSGLDKVVEQVDLKHLILETDSPYLAPTPHRGKRNEPSYIPIIANKIAEVKAIDIHEVMKTTTQTAHDLFDW
ncbi:MAG: TatD family hydrolase [Flavobacteriales bacterium]|nr:TatD family hydrolase [Flavobacteriales bacterium]MCB9205320.1 TatD family hydrolase [Flavobacteriales bacterium]